MPLDRTPAGPALFAAAIAVLASHAAAADARSGDATPATTAVASEPRKGAFSDADERVYLERFRKERAGQRLSISDAYEPLEPVPGALAWRPLPAATPRERTISPEALATADRYASSSNSNAFIVWRRGKIEWESYFEGHSREAPIISRSLAKPVAAVAVGRAIALGLIRSLDQPVADFIAEWRGDARRSRILVRHLLDMRAGFLTANAAPDPDDIINRSYLHPRHEEIIVHDYPVVDEPGTRYEYGNAPSDLVAVVIERATGRRYAEFVSAQVLREIGAPGGAVWVNRPGGTAHSGCCLMLPAESFLRLAILLLQDGRWDGRRLLPEGYVAAMTRGTDENPYFGLGVFVAGRYVERRGAAHPDRPLPKTLHGEPYLAADLYLFDGNANQVVYVVPSQSLVVLRTGNPPPRTDGREWDNAYLPNMVMRGIRAFAGTSVPQPR